MSDGHDRVIGFKLVDQFFNFCRGDGIECRAGLIHQKHFRLDRERARDAKPLLLAAGETRARLVQIIFHLVPKRSHAKRFLQALVKKLSIANTVESQSDYDILANRHRRERIGFLENHADSAPNDCGIDIARIEILSIKQYCTF